MVHSQSLHKLLRTAVLLALTQLPPWPDPCVPLMISLRTTAAVSPMAAKLLTITAVPCWHIHRSCPTAFFARSSAHPHGFHNKYFTLQNSCKTIDYYSTTASIDILASWTILFARYLKWQDSVYDKHSPSLGLATRCILNRVWGHAESCEVVWVLLWAPNFGCQGATQ